MRKVVIILIAVALAIVPAAFVSQAQAASRYAVTLNTSKTEINQGDQVIFFGKVSPTAKGSSVSIQYFDIDQGGNRWRTVTTTTVRSDGTYAINVTPRDGSTSYRVYKPAGSGLSSGASPSVVMRAYGWYTMSYNTDLIQLGEEYLEQYGPQTVAGVPVVHYWASTATAGGKTHWTTLHTCKRVRAEVGLDDRSDPGANAQFRIDAGAKRLVNLPVTKGTMTPVDVAVPRAESATIRFSAAANNALTPTYVVASNPRVFCAFPEDD